MNATTIGLDIAKQVFQVHGVDRAGKTVLRKQLKRAQVLAFFANLPPAVIGLEACAGAHYCLASMPRSAIACAGLPPEAGWICASYTPTTKA